MLEEKEEILKRITSLMNVANNLMEAVLREDKKSISYWNKSIGSWRGHVNKSMKRYLKTLKDTIKDEVPF